MNEPKTATGVGGVEENKRGYQLSWNTVVVAETIPRYFSSFHDTWLCRTDTTQHKGRARAFRSVADLLNYAEKNTASFAGVRAIDEYLRRLLGTNYQQRSLPHVLHLEKNPHNEGPCRTPLGL